MKKRSFVQALFFFINTLFAATLILAHYVLPFISPKTAPAFAVVSLFVPVLILINAIFAVYWILKLDKRFLLSSLILAGGWSFVSPLYKLTEKKILLNNDLKIMSYNVRLFNHYSWTDDSKIPEKISALINEKAPDIIAFQEFYKTPKASISYPYSYIKTSALSHKFGLAIYSKYPILNKGSLNFKNSGNNIIFADILVKKDTIRIYNIHLESLKINPNTAHFGQENSEKLFKRLEKGFQKQATQAAQFLAHEQQWKGKKVICGDFNNTAYSWVYQQIAAGKKDAFVEAGKGFGKSFHYLFPLRIDFILTDTSIAVHQFKTIPKHYSDHYPILARIALN